jgi:type I restriction enzyme, S subunit
MGELFSRGPFGRHKSFKRYELGLCPEDWAISTLAEVASGGGGLQTGPFGSQLHASDYSDEGIPVIMAKDRVGGRVAPSTIARIPLERTRGLERHVVRRVTSSLGGGGTSAVAG